MSKKIYLAGNISEDPKTYEWRQKATRLLGGEFEIIDPTDNNYNRQLIRQNAYNPEGFLQSACINAQHLLMVKDYNLIKEADVVLVNLKLITPDKPPIGTLFEIAWAWQLHKPIIAIVGDNIYSRHPFPTGAISMVVYTVEEACEKLYYFFGKPREVCYD